jgi:hypothetical protein
VTETFNSTASGAKYNETVNLNMTLTANGTVFVNGTTTVVGAGVNATQVNATLANILATLEQDLQGLQKTQMKARGAKALRFRSVRTHV